MQKNNYIVGFDIGTKKTAAIIGEITSEKKIEIGYNGAMESRLNSNDFKHPVKYYGPILSSDSYEPGQRDKIPPADSPRLLHIPVDRIRIGSTQKNKKKNKWG